MSFDPDALDNIENMTLTAEQVKKARENIQHATDQEIKRVVAAIKQLKEADDDRAVLLDNLLALAKLAAIIFVA